MVETRWWDGITTEALHGGCAAALSVVDRLTLGRLYGLPDDARGLLRLGLPGLHGPDPSGGLRGSHSASYQPEDGRALRVLSARANFAEGLGGMTFRGADGGPPAPGSPEARANALVEAARREGRPAVAGAHEVRRLHDLRFGTAATAVPYGVESERLWVRASELALATGRRGGLEGLPRADAAVARFVNRHLDAVRQPVFEGAVASGETRAGPDGAAMLLAGFGATTRGTRALANHPRVVAAKPRGAAALEAVRLVSEGRGRERDAARARAARAPTRPRVAEGLARAV